MKAVILVLVMASVIGLAKFWQRCDEEAAQCEEDRMDNEEVPS